MKKIPLVSIPVIAFIIIFILFATIVPENGDLISASGDMVLGQVIIVVFVILLIVDIRRFIKNKKDK